MKKSSRAAWCSLLVVASLTLPLSMVSANEANWKAFSKNLVVALQSDNPGLQQSAMQLVIEHGDRVDVKAAVFHVMRVFRHHPDRQVRLLALAALTRMNSSWASGFLKRHIQFEGDPVIRDRLIRIFGSPIN
ncbi:MAG: hypothetical protein D6681_03750 [Calditrichaeota bacterium]|nr:MAG: hypothetical protein D6681_03750 [Calditrichota bacterium]